MKTLICLIFKEDEFLCKFGKEYGEKLFQKLFAKEKEFIRNCSNIERSVSWTHFTAIFFLRTCLDIFPAFFVNNRTRYKDIPWLF